jgi:hypothetical protein
MSVISTTSICDCAASVLLQKELGQGGRLLPDDLPLREEEEESR